MLRARILVLPSVLALAAACNDGGGPTAPASNPSGVAIVINDPGGELRGVEGTIRGLLETTIARVGSQLPIADATIFVAPDPSRAIPGWGIGGRASGGTRVDLSLDPRYPGLASLLDERLPSLAAHELHHIARMRGPGYGATLLGAMVSEGLADQYALELYGRPSPPWVTELVGAELDFWLDRAESEFDSTSYDHDAWFFGGSAIPRWAGYAIGHRLVADYQASHSGDSAAELVNTPADAFRPD